MKVLSIKNPWADWIMFGRKGNFKNTENRTWEVMYRGRLLIHVSKTLDRYAAERYNAKPEDYERWKEQAGKIIGTVELYAIDRDIQSFWDESDLFHWRIRDPQPLKKPVPALGRLGLWEYTGELK